jgi:hypothetical protein
MTFELPGVVWVVLLAWIVASLAVAAGLARWFRFIR